MINDRPLVGFRRVSYMRAFTLYKSNPATRPLLAPVPRFLDDNLPIDPLRAPYIYRYTIYALLRYSKIYLFCNYVREPRP
jgi:hypothetical protein